MNREGRPFIPRRIRRGLIEGLLISQVGAPRLGTIPRRIRRGLIEGKLLFTTVLLVPSIPGRIRRGLIEGIRASGTRLPGSSFPGEFAGASLKAEYLDVESIVLSNIPRRIRRGLIEGSDAFKGGNGRVKHSPANSPGPH